MKITVGQLRRLIREMALSAVSSPISTAPARDEETKNEKQIKRFFSSPKFKADAERLFKHWSVPVYIVPAYSEDYKYLPSTRSKHLTWEQALPILSKTDLDLEQLKSDLDSGGIIFINSATELVANFLASVWMMIHALFDQGRSPKEMWGVGEKTEGAIRSYVADALKGESSKLKSEFLKAWRESITSKAGRTGSWSSDDSTNDFITEMLVQAALTTKGCVLKEYENDDLPPEQVEKINGILRGLQDLVNSMNVRELLESALSGGIVSIATI